MIDKNIPKGTDRNISEVLKLLSDTELVFIEKELRRKGVIFESVQDALSDDLRAIYERMDEIMAEEAMLGGGCSIDENGKEIEWDAHPDYDPDRRDIAEGVFITLDDFIEFESNGSEETPNTLIQETPTEEEPPKRPSRFSE